MTNATNRVKVTDHAVLRYLEREAGVDVEGVRHHIAESLNKSWTDDFIVFAGNAPFKVKAPDLTCCIKGGVVTTCYPK